MQYSKRCIKMTSGRFFSVVFVAFVLLAGSLLRAGEAKPPELPKGLKDLSIGALWYLSYQNGESGGNDYDKFVIKRGYIDVQKKLAPWLDARITPDVTQDDTGDVKVRLKYAYAKLNINSQGFLTKPNLEFGLAHTPWLDFEEHVNIYRCQDTMFSERNGNFASADFGVMFGGLLGGEVDKEYQKQVTKAYPGKYGSFAVGVYNGGGYHAKEKNENKALEGRITIRPAPGSLPGLQFSYFGVYGKGNVAPTPTLDAPDWRFNLAFVSYEHKYATLTGQYLYARGNAAGTFVDSHGEAYKHDGYSFFGEARMPAQKSSILARWDHYKPNKDVSDNENDRTIVGYAYHLPMGSMFLVDYERLNYQDPARKDDWRVQATIQIKYP
jgi:hypothetical protein